MGFKENLKMLRKSKGMTQEEFGKLINKSKLTIIRYESGETFPNLETLKEIAEKLEVPVQQLLSSDGITQDDFIANATEIAIKNKYFYDAHIEVGFTEEQAFELLITTITEFNLK